LRSVAYRQVSSAKRAGGGDEYLHRDPASRRSLPHGSQLSLYSRSTDRTENTHSHIRIVVRVNVFIEPLPRNGFRYTAVLLLRKIATDCLPRDCLRGINIRPIVERGHARRCLSCRCLAIHVTISS
jgi:hypothetical protein